MYRRNGKLMACEPCRRSKLRCDHTTPVCLKCQTRGIVNQCHFHPAPMTRVRSRNSPVRSRPRNVRPRIPATAVADQSPPQLLSNPTPKSTPSTQLHPRTPDDSTGSFYLGSTSYASAFEGLDCHDEDPARGNGQVGPNASAAVRLNNRLGANSLIASKPNLNTGLGVELLIKTKLVSLAIYEKALEDFFSVSVNRASSLMGSLILPAIPQIKTDLEGLAIGSTWDTICARVTENTARSFKVPPTITSNAFHTLFSGPNLRWEIIGLMFAIAGFHAQFTSPDDHLFDLGNGRKLNRDEFIFQMIEGSNSCIYICQEHNCVNDLMIWLLYHNGLLQSNYYGDSYHGVWRRMGDAVICSYAEGYHCEERFEVPFFLREARRRVFSAMYRSDKTLATFFGRPPLIAGRYCNRKLPFDLDEEFLATDNASALNAALARLDAYGWNTDGAFHTTTWLRLRYTTAMFREKVLELSLAGETDNDLSEKLRKLSHENKVAWESLPQHLRYELHENDCWTTLTPEISLRMFNVYLDHLCNEFQLQRLRQRHFQDATADLLKISMHLLKTGLVLNKQRNRDYRMQRHYASTILWYCLPGAGVLALELRRCTLEHKPLPGSIKRADLIRNLSTLISLLEAIVYPGDGNHKLCAELNKVLALILDEVLNYQGTSESGPENGLDQLDQLTFFDLPVMDGMEPVPTESEDFLNWLDNANWDHTYLT